MCVYYASTLLRDLSELPVRTARDSYLPIHDIAAVHGPFNQLRSAVRP